MGEIKALGRIGIGIGIGIVYHFGGSIYEYIVLFFIYFI